MKIVLQRVARASVTVDNNVTGSIDKGYLILLGVGDGDDKSKIEKSVDKVQKLRLFPDVNGMTNFPINAVNGGILVVSQFTLCADCHKGNRPSFVNAAPPALAEELYEYFIEYSQGRFDKVQCGVFGASMQVELVNNGPFTVVLEEF